MLGEGPSGLPEFPWEGKVFTHKPQEKGAVFPSSLNTDMELVSQSAGAAARGQVRGHPGTLVQWVPVGPGNLQV